MNRIAWVSWSLNIYCDCGVVINLAEYDDAEVYSVPIFNNKWDELTGKEIYCPKCGKKIVISGVEC
jgi:hypothetical protein